MPSSADLSGLDTTKLNLGEFAARFRGEAIAHNAVFSYFPAALQFTGEDVREFVEEPIQGLPGSVLSAVGKIVLLFVPYLERPAVKGKNMEFDAADCKISLDAPERGVNMPVVYLAPSEPGVPHVLAFGVRDVDSTDYHYNFFYSVASLVFLGEPETVLAGYRNILREELKSRAHGEVDEPGWKAKLNMLNKETGVRGDTKLFREYARHSFIDTMTLYLHGICCDIDVEPGPRQIASRYLRKRLQYLQIQYPQPEGYAVFPEELKN